MGIKTGSDLGGGQSAQKRKTDDGEGERNHVVPLHPIPKNHPGQHHRNDGFHSNDESVVGGARSGEPLELKDTHSTKSDGADGNHGGPVFRMF